MATPTGKFSDMTKEESLVSCAKERHELRKQKQQPTAILKTFSQIEEKPVEWLWDGHIPLSMFCIFAGDAGLGKSTLSLDISARLSRSLPFPDNSKPMLGDTLILAGEDDPSYTIKPRLQALGADMDRIHILMGKRGDQDEDFTIMDTGIIRDAIDQIRANGGDLKLLIVDPLESFLAGTVDIFRNNEVRASLRGLIALAQKERFTVVAIQHLTKKTGISANYRISGSIAFVAAARTVWMVTKDPENPRNCLFLNSKMNIGPKVDGFRYSIESSETGIGVPAWGARVTTDPDDVLNAPPTPKQAPEQEKVLELIQEKHPMAIKAKEIVEKTGKGSSRVSNILNELERQGKVKKATGLYGYWQLSQHNPIGSVCESESYTQVSHELTQGVKVECENIETEKQEPELDIF